MSNNFQVKDSGERQQFDSGMQRDTQKGKTLYHLVFDGPMIHRWAEHLTKGAEKYSEGNWLKAAGEAELKRFRASAVRHFIQWLMGETDEDHAAAVLFNINGVEYVKGQKNSTAHRSSHNERYRLPDTSGTSETYLFHEVAVNGMVCVYENKLEISRMTKTDLLAAGAKAVAG